MHHSKTDETEAEVEWKKHHKPALQDLPDGDPARHFDESAFIQKNLKGKQSINPHLVSHTISQSVSQSEAINQLQKSIRKKSINQSKVAEIVNL